MMRHLSSLPRLLLLALLLVAAPALAETLPVPALSGRVVDQAGILNSAEESRLTAKLKDLEDKTSIQLMVVTLSSLRGSPIEDWGLALGRSWGIGQKGKDNGALLIVAPNNRELRIEVGYGLEGTLPDATADAIIRNVIVPRFKNGNMAGGISDGVDAIIAMFTGTGEAFAPSRLNRLGKSCPTSCHCSSLVSSSSWRSCRSSGKVAGGAATAISATAAVAGSMSDDDDGIREAAPTIVQQRRWRLQRRRW